MLFNFYQLSNARKLENAIFFSIILFVFKVIFPFPESAVLILANEALVVSTFYFWMIYFSNFIHKKASSPFSIVLNAGIINAVVFFVISISSYLIPQESFETESNLIITVYNSLVAFLFLGAITFIFTSFRELFFLKQKKNPKMYFQTMLVFITITALTEGFYKFAPDLDFIPNAFFIVSIVLIAINSLRVAWIAFLSKKQKLYLLLISVLLILLFGFNYALVAEDNFMLLGEFSGGLNILLSLIMLYGTISFAIIFFTSLFHLPTAAAFERKAEEASSLMDLSKLITQVFDFKELADSVTSLTTKVCKSDSAWLVIKSDDEIKLSSVNNIGFMEADKITGSLLNENEDITSMKVISAKPIKVQIRNDIKTFSFNSVVVAPLKVHNEIKGYLFTARKEDYSFDDEDLNSISAFADYSAVALENAKLIEESIEKERLEKELDVAREIQYKIVPNNIPQPYGYDISALFIPAFEVGGDYYDFFEIDKNKLGFVIADVSGKGISAAFIMAEIKGIFESLSRLAHSPKELLTLTNEILNDSLDKKNFVTAVYGILDTSKHTINWARAGHAPLMHFNNGEVESLTPSGIGLGIDKSNKFGDALKELEIKLNINDIIVLYTDGINESQNTKLEEFGYERLERIIKNNSEKTSAEISREIMHAVTTFSEGSQQHDDITLVVIKYDKK